MSELDVTERLQHIAGWGGTTGVVTTCRDARAEIDRLRAENAELKEWTMTLNAQECDRLRAENERLNFEAENWCPDSRPCSCRVEIERLRAEVERHKRQIHHLQSISPYNHTAPELAAENMRLRTENERLRDALTVIFRKTTGWGSEWSICRQLLIDIKAESGAILASTEKEAALRAAGVKFDSAD